MKTANSVRIYPPNNEPVCRKAQRAAELLNRGLQLLGLLGCLIHCVMHLFLNREQLHTTPGIPHYASNPVGQKSSSHSRSVSHMILLAQTGCTHAGVPK